MVKKVKSGGKRQKCKTHVSKLNNKRLNKLARQGKLKGRTGGLDKFNYRQILQNRVRPNEQRRLVEEDEDCGQERLKPELGDIPLEEADYDYFATEHEHRHLGFLENNLELKANSSKKSKLSKKQEECYELTPRLQSKHSKAGDDKPLLPIKSSKGGLVLRTASRDDEDEESEDDLAEEVNNDEEEEEEQIELPPVTMEQLISMRKEKLIQKKILISSTASLLIEDPQKNIKKLSILHDLMNDTDSDTFITIRKLATISLLEIFKDIIPSYRIRELTEIERSQKMKKDTKCIVDFEDSLLLSYKAYLTNLEVMIKGAACKSLSNRKRRAFEALNMPPQAFKEIRKLAIKCLLDLLTTCPHFNYRTNIISLAIPFIDHRDTQLAQSVYDSICRVFNEDKEGEVTLEIVRLIGRLVKTRHFTVRPLVLDTFLALKIKEIAPPSEGGKKKKFLREKASRRERKRKTNLFNLEKELDNADVATNKRKRLRFNAEIINLVFLSYFRILKQARHSKLLSSVLAGLAQFAHLINVEFFDDLFSVINELVDSGELSHRNSLYCIQTAFTILSGQGDILNIDPLRFYNHLYCNLYTLHAGDSCNDSKILLECLSSMIGKRRKQISRPRMLAFIKRLSILSINQLSNATISILATLRKFIQIDSKLDIVFDPECQGSGMYDGELDEPEYANAHNTCLYELHLLRKHFHPSVRTMSDNFIAGLPSQGVDQLPIELSRKSPQELYEIYDASQMKFKPPVKGKAAGKKYRFYNINKAYCQDEMCQLSETITKSLPSSTTLNFAKHLRRNL